MAQAGQTIVNKITGETLTFTQTSAMTDGKLLEFHLTLAPGSKVPMKHIHTEQNEIFEVITGIVYVETGKTGHVIKPGEKILMKKGIPHRWRNHEELSSTLIVRFEPAGNTEDFFVEMFSLAASGKTKPNGAPAFLQAARMCGKYNIYHPWIPICLQKVFSKMFNI